MHSFNWNERNALHFFTYLNGYNANAIHGGNQILPFKTEMAGNVANSYCTKWAKNVNVLQKIKHNLIFLKVTSKNKNLNWIVKWGNKPNIRLNKNGIAKNYMTQNGCHSANEKPPIRIKLKASKMVNCFELKLWLVSYCASSQNTKMKVWQSRQPNGLTVGSSNAIHKSVWLCSVVMKVKK